MNMHPLFAWSILLAPDAALPCVAGPAWLREISDSIDDCWPRAAAVSWGRSLAETPQLARYDAWAGFNAPRMDTVLMRHAGFNHVRRYAIVPGARDPRWFIPLDKPAVSRSAMELLQPVTLKSRAHRMASRLAVGVRRKWWYRDTLTLALREPPRLESAMQRALGSGDIRLAICSGSRIGAANRKITTAAIDTTGRLHGFAKIADTPLLNRKLQHEADMLDVLACHSVSAYVPQRLFRGEVEGRFVTLISPLPGDAARPQLTADHYELLAMLRSATTKPASMTGFVQNLERRTAMLKAHRRFGMALDVVMPTLARTNVPLTIMHGDFTPWNLRRERGTIYAFDWEQAHLDGLPLVDELHHEMAVGYLLKHWSVTTAANYLTRFASNQPLGMSPQQVRAIIVTYLVDYLARLVEAGHSDDAPRLVWYDRLLETITPKRPVSRRPDMPVSARRKPEFARA